MLQPLGAGARGQCCAVLCHAVGLGVGGAVEPVPASPPLGAPALRGTSSSLALLGLSCWGRWGRGCSIPVTHSPAQPEVAAAGTVLSLFMLNP